MIQVIRRSSVTASRWKNGGGVTQEFIRVPAGNAAFRWRLSIAQVDESGPFSDFAGYHRTMLLLRGAGVRLDIEGEPAKVLAAVGAVAEFDGARKTDCQLLEGPCTDLNLMVAHSMRRVAARVELVGERRLVPASPSVAAQQPADAQPPEAAQPPERAQPPVSRDGVLLIFPIVGGLAVEPAAGPAVRLSPWDLAILPAGGTEMVAPDADSSCLVFFATLDDNLRLPP